MGPKERFKLAVLLLCADVGMSLGETLVFVKKANETKDAGLGGSALSLGGKMVGWPLHKLFWGLALAPPLLGAAGGWGAARLTAGLNDKTPKEVKYREVIEELRRQAERTRMQADIAARKKERTSMRGRGLL